MKNKLNTTICFLIIFFMTGGFVWFVKEVKADTNITSSTIKAEVTSTSPSPSPSPTPSSGGGGGSDESPTISNVTSSARISSAIVKWTATDDNNVQSCEFKYSPGVNYNLTATPIETSQNNYKVSLSGLTPSTTYNFKIICKDSVQQSEELGQFKTLSSAMVDLELVAEPEKRVDNNMSMEFTLLFANPNSNNILSNVNGSTTSTGKFEEKNVKIPAGTGYAAILKGRSHLAKRVVGVDVSDGKKLTLDFTDQGNFKLLAGDVAGSGTKDNFVDVLDISAILSMLNTDNKEGDLNRDGIVDILDVSILLKNFNKSGDNIPTLN